MTVHLFRGYYVPLIQVLISDIFDILATYNFYDVRFANFVDYGEDKKKPKEEKKEDVAKSQEEKRKHIKSLIDKIPTDKSALFSFPLDWAAVDNVSFLLSCFCKSFFSLN